MLSDAYYARGGRGAAAATGTPPLVLEDLGLPGDAQIPPQSVGSPTQNSWGRLMNLDGETRIVDHPTIFHAAKVDEAWKIADEVSLCTPRKSLRVIGQRNFARAAGIHPTGPCGSTLESAGKPGGKRS